jgi:hypothetical protein
MESFWHGGTTVVLISTTRPYIAEGLDSLSNDLGLAENTGQKIGARHVGGCPLTQVLTLIGTEYELWFPHRYRKNSEGS